MDTILNNLGIIFTAMLVIMSLVFIHWEVNRKLPKQYQNSTKTVPPAPVRYAGNKTKLEKGK